MLVWTCHLQMALSQNSSSSTPTQRKKCSVCGVWLCQWQEHDVCVIHYGIECTKGGSCPVCCEWTDELWDLSNNQKVHRLELLEQTKQKKKFFQDIKGTTSKVKGPSSTKPKVRPTPPSKTKTRPSKIIDSMEDNTFFQEVVRSENKSEQNKSKLKSSVVSNPGKQSSCTVSADTKSLKMGQSSVGTKPTKLLSKSNLSMCSIDISLSDNSPAVQTLECGKRKRKPSSTKKHVKEDMEEEEEKEDEEGYGLWTRKSHNRFIETIPAGNKVDPAPVGDSTDSDSHCERALCLSSQEGQDGQSTNHDIMGKAHKSTRYSSRGGFMATNEVDPAPVGDSTDSDSHCERALRLSSQEDRHSTDHDQDDYMAKTHKSTRYGSRGGFRATDHGPMGSHRSTGYGSPGRSTGSPTIHGYGDAGQSALGMETHRSALGKETHRASLGMETHRSALGKETHRASLGMETHRSLLGMDTHRPTGYDSQAGSMDYTDNRARTTPHGAWGHQDQFIDYAIPRGDFHSVENMQGEENEDLEERDTNLTKFRNRVAMVRRMHGDNLSGPTTIVQEAPTVRSSYQMERQIYEKILASLYLD